MTKKLFSLMAVTGLLTAGAAFAAPDKTDPSRNQWEVTGGAGGALNFTSVNPVLWNYAVTGTVGYHVANGFQVVLGPSVLHQWNGTQWTFDFAGDAGVRLNTSFTEKMANDWFVLAGARLGVVSLVTLPSGATANGAFTARFLAQAGKRFAINENISYSPSVEVSVGNLIGFAIKPIQFSMFF